MFLPELRTGSNCTLSQPYPWAAVIMMSWLMYMHLDRLCLLLLGSFNSLIYSFFLPYFSQNNWDVICNMIVTLTWFSCTKASNTSFVPLVFSSHASQPLLNSIMISLHWGLLTTNQHSWYPLPLRLQLTISIACWRSKWTIQGSVSSSLTTVLSIKSCHLKLLK